MIDRYHDRLRRLQEAGNDEAAMFLQYLFVREQLDEGTLAQSDEELTAAALVEQAFLRHCRAATAAALEEQAYLRRCQAAGQICTSTKIPSGRGLSPKTFALRAAIMEAFEETDKPVTVRQMFYMLTVRGAVEKEESGYRKVQRQLVLLRREGEVPYNWIADNTRWMRKPTTYAGLGDFFARAAVYYRQDLWVRSDRLCRGGARRTRSRGC